MISITRQFVITQAATYNAWDAYTAIYNEVSRNERIAAYHELADIRDELETSCILFNENVQQLRDCAHRLAFQSREDV